jgi:hypothetical protein
MSWKPIKDAPKDKRLVVAYYYVPSKYAAINGAKPFWDIAKDSIFLAGSWTSVLSGKPSHWMFPEEYNETILPPQGL